MNVGDLVVLIPDHSDASWFVLPHQVGMITERDDNYEAKGMSGNLVNLVKVQFGDVSSWYDTDQVEVIDESR